MAKKKIFGKMLDLIGLEETDDSGKKNLVRLRQHVERIANNRRYTPSS